MKGSSVLFLSFLILANYATCDWQLISCPTTNDLNDVQMESATLGWMAGYDFTARYDTTAWTVIPIGIPNLNITGIHSTSGLCAEACALGGVVLSYDGSQWQTMSDPTTNNLNDILMDNDDGRIVGDHIALAYSLTYGWIAVSWGYNINWVCIDGLNINNYWVGGEQGQMLQAWGSPNPDSHPAPTTATITGVWMTNAGNTWACSSTGEIFHWTNNQWSKIEQPNTVPLSGICVPSLSLGFAVGNNGRILKYDGVNWTIADSPTTQNLNEISMPTTDFGFIVGDNGTLLEFGPDSKVETSTLGNIKSLYHK